VRIFASILSPRTKGRYDHREAFSRQPALRYVGPEILLRVT
jgi:hypothetical protein